MINTLPPASQFNQLAISANSSLILDDVCELIVDCEHKTAPLSESGYPSIRTPNIGRGRLLLDGVNRVDESTYRYWTKRAIPQADDLIIAREAPVGNVAIIPPELKVCLGQRTVLARPDKSKVSPTFLLYFLLSDYAQGEFHGASTGSTVRHLNMKDIRNLRLPPFPSLENQEHIGSILSAYDRLIDNNNRQIALLEEAVHLLYREWFVHMRFPGHERVRVVDGVPEGWRRGTLGDVLTLQRGFDLPSNDRNEGSVPVIAASGVNGYHSTSKVVGPGVVTGRSGTIGNVFYIHEDFWPLNTALWVKDLKGISHIFAYYVLKGVDLTKFQGGVAVPTLNRNQAHTAAIMIPSSDTISEFDDIASNSLKTIRCLEQQNAKLAAARDALLPRLMNGSLAV